MANSGGYPRGIERSPIVLEAVARLIVKVGIAGVSPRAVAREAGVSLRATTYCFETKEEMIREALRGYVQKKVIRTEAVAAHFPSRSNKLESAVDAVATVMLEEMSDSQDTLRTEYELILGISREPRYAPVYEEANHLLEMRLRSLMVAIGSEDPRRHARLVIAAMRGLQMDYLASREAGACERSLRDYLRVLLRAFVPSSEKEDF